MIKNFFQKILIILFTLVLGPNIFAAKLAHVEVQNLADTVHLEFFGYDNWSYDIKKIDKDKKNLVELSLPLLDKASIEKLKQIGQLKNQNLVKSVTVDESGSDGKQKVIFETTEGNVDLFDYLTDQPSRLIIDVYVNKNQKIEKVVKKEKSKPAKKINAKQNKEEKDNRVPASTDALVVANQGPISDSLSPKNMALYDGADPKFERFAVKDYETKDTAIEYARENSYLDFPALKLEMSELKDILAKSPTYDIDHQDTDENKQAQLLMTLYTRNRYNVFLKTLDWFKEKFPKSKYNETFDFIKADIYASFWKKDNQLSAFDKAVSQYEMAVTNYPNSPLSERTKLLIPSMYLERGDYLEALKRFQTYAKKETNKKLVDLAKYASADIMLKLKKYDDAVNMYKEIEFGADERALKIKSSCLIGDIYYQQKDYDKALSQYQATENKYLDLGINCPDLHFNKAAALFKTEKFQKSLDSYRDFLIKYPKNDYAGFAMTRVGEIMDILGVDKNRSQGAYLETYFRYGESQSSIVARLRMLGNKIKSMKPKEIEKSVDEIVELAKTSDLPQIEQFTKVIIADGYSERGDNQKAIDLLVGYFQDNPTSADKALISKKVVNYINQNLYALLQKGNFLDFFKFHKKYADTWLKSADRIDTQYFLANAFEQAGAFGESENLYKEAINKYISVQGTPKEKQLYIQAQIPNLDMLQLRLAKVESDQGKLSESYESLKQIKSPEKLSEENQIERISLSVDLLDKKGDLNTATKYLTDLIKEWRGQPALVAKPYYQLAIFEKKQNKLDEALSTLEKIEALKEDSNQVDSETHAKSLELKAEIELTKNQTDKAIETYKNLLEKYENTIPLSSIRYKTGLLLFKKGEIQKASDVWQGLKGDKNALWYKLAQENLKSSEWNSEYKKYIKRIPAMTNDKSTK